MGEQKVADTALRRIYSAAIGIEHGEENPREAAQDIQRMVINALANEVRFDWSWKEYEPLAKMFKERADDER